MTTTLDANAATAGGSTLLPRDRWGRPMVVTPDGRQVAYTRATTIAGAIDDLYGLMDWKQRQTAVGLAARKDLLLRAASLGPQPVDEKAKRTWKAQMDDVCEAAMEASASSASATIGTALHSYTEAIDQARVEGRTWSGNVPHEYAPHLIAYQDATKDLTVYSMETFLVNDDMLVGGTTDRLVSDPGLPGIVIADVKTGSLDYPHKMAMQLAIYAHSLVYDPVTHVRTPIPGINQEVGIIIALNALTGECDLRYIDIASGWNAVQLALKVREWRGKKNLTRPVTRTTPALPEPEPEPAAEAVLPIAGARVAKERDDAALVIAVDVAVENARSQKELLAIANAAKAHDRWSDQLNAAAGARWASLPAA
jgi:hypothetical protein